MSKPAEPISPASTPQSTAPQHIDTSSPNNVGLWVRNSIKEGRLKDCANLDIDEIVETFGDNTGDLEKQTYSFFIPVCKHRSFVTTYGPMSDERQEQFLRRNLAGNPLSCPKNCGYYRSRRWTHFKVAVSTPVVAFARFMKAMLTGYAALPWQTQVTLISAPALFLILWKAPEWVPQIIALAKALWGK